MKLKQTLEGKTFPRSEVGEKRAVGNAACLNLPSPSNTG